MPTRRALAARCERWYRHALSQLGAEALVRAALVETPGWLGEGPWRVLALGKAAAPMLRGALAVLGERARDVLAVLPEGGALVLAEAPSARVLRGGHPRPDAGSAEAGRALETWADAGQGAPALVLLSGGASALAVAPAEGVGLEEKAQAIAALMAAGAPIGSLNAVRKHLSRLKGGQLALRLYPARVEVLVLSDVPGDELSVIGSGPFAADPSTFAQALEVVETSGARLPVGVLAALGAGAQGRRAETPKPGDPRLTGVRHRILAGPVDLARAVAAAARDEGFDAQFDAAPLTGTVEALAARLESLVAARNDGGRWLLAMGGEPTIELPRGAPAPDGGRAQHLALRLAPALAGLDACVLAAGSDGRDGPTEQAGAVVDGYTLADARAAGVDLKAALGAARSGPAAVACGAAIPRFESPTHLGDVVLLAVEEPRTGQA
jgi:glycerate-2-kinase